jgi:hypothetical protein
MYAAANVDRNRAFSVLLFRNRTYTNLFSTGCHCFMVSTVAYVVKLMQIARQEKELESWRDWLEGSSLVE